MAASDPIPVEVVYAAPLQQQVYRLLLPAGTTAQQAVKQSGVLQAHPELQAQPLTLGIYGKAVKAEQVLRARDRVEIYRPLLGDPKEIRRRRAAEAQQRRTQGTS